MIISYYLINMHALWIMRRKIIKICTAGNWKNFTATPEVDNIMHE